MTTSIKVLRENLVKSLSSLKDDNVSIAGIEIQRRTLLEALKLQTADTVTLSYGTLSWQDGQFGRERYNNTKWHDDSLAPESALQVTCGRAVMRFLNRPKVARNPTPQGNVRPLAFVDQLATTSSEVSGIAVDTRELLDALTYVLPCVATEESRPPLRCVCFDSKQEVLTLASADGYRLGIAKINVKGLPDLRVNIHSRDVSSIITFLKRVKPEGWGKGKYYPETYVSITDKNLTLAGPQPLEVPTQVGHFPDYAQLIPNGGTEIQFIASDLYETVKALAPYAKDGSGIIRMEFKPDDLLGKIRVSARSEELGESAGEIDASVSGDARIAANCNYIMGVLRLCGDDTVTLKVTLPSSPMVFETGPNRTTVVMPMFVQWGQADVKPEPTPEPEDIETPEDELEPIDGDPRDLVESEAM